MQKLSFYHNIIRLKICLQFANEHIILNEAVVEHNFSNVIHSFSVSRIFRL